MKIILFVQYSAYDFAYMIRLLKGENLPKDETGFFELMKLYFPNVYDIKVSLRIRVWPVGCHVFFLELLPFVNFLKNFDLAST